MTAYKVLVLPTLEYTAGVYIIANKTRCLNPWLHAVFMAVAGVCPLNHGLSLPMIAALSLQDVGTFLLLSSVMFASSSTITV